ncbi:MAG: pyridoxal phosphate-dependent aminotransferase [Deltaproteobacteria bacterium]|nr:pyridoxal phosphate-dependent aminotransferase [Deltaproteobacteria bacterium]
MSLKFHPRVDQLEPFLAMEVMERAFAMEREGSRVIHFGVGEPGVAPPPEAVDACVAALRGGETRYTDSRGLVELRRAVAAEQARRSGQAVDPDQVLVTSGTSPAMLLVFGLLAGPGDEIILGTPHYPCYPSFIRFCGGTPVLVATGPGDGWQLDPAAVRAAVTPRTRAIVVGSPANPTGAVQAAETLDALGALGPPLISDEIYHGLTYDGVQAASALGRAEHVFVLDGFSKRYAMTGFRLGYAVVPPAALRKLQVMQQNLFISANRFVQHAGVAALEHGAPMVERLRKSLDGRRLRMVEGLRELGLGVERPPQGAFYVFADARRFGSDSLRLAFDILERAQVACTPGIDFGAAGEGFLRFSYTASEADLEEGLKRLARALPELA